MAPYSYDVLVLGTGVAATTAAYECRAAGRKVAVVDSRPFGGTCALRGCDPKKVLVGAAELTDWIDRMREKGIAGEHRRIEWPSLMRFKRSFTDPVPAHKEDGFSQAGIAAYRGRASFLSPTAVQVNGERVEARHVVIATGAKPVELPIPGTEYLTTSDQFLELDELPQRLVLLGGGYISFEFAHIAARCGARVTMLDRGERPLKRFDPDLVEQLVRRTRDLGIDLHVNTEVKGLERTDQGILVHTSTAGQPRAHGADMVIHGAGRVPDVADLNLEAAGVRSEPKRGVVVNAYLQSVSNPAVYAAGDATVQGEGPPLTPVGIYEGEIVAANLLHGNQQIPDYTAVPSVVFTVPPLASVGLSEQTARARGFHFRVNHQVTSSWYSARRVNEPCAGFKVLIEEGTERVLGAHLIGPHAEEVINLFAVAIRAGLPTKALSGMLLAYPTHGFEITYMVGS